MRLLLDTNVISELSRSEPSPHVLRALQTVPQENLYLSVITFGEVAKGTARLPAGRRKAELTAWLAGLLKMFTDRLLPVDTEIAEIWGRNAAAAEQQGFRIPAIDGLIAATAIRHGLTVVTRNSKDFVRTGVPLLDPWK